MLAVAFDSLKLARTLESAGFDRRQAQDAAAGIAQFFSEGIATANLASRELWDLRHCDERSRQQRLVSRAPRVRRA